MEEEIRIQDDLYLHVNKKRLDELVIPEDLPFAGGFAELHLNVEKTLMKEFKDLEKTKAFPNENVKKAITLYSLARNTKKRDKQGLKPIEKDLKTILSTADVGMFNRRLYSFVVNRYPLPFSFAVDVDLKDSNKRCLSLSGPSTILPDTTMYDPANPSKEPLLNAWKGVALQLLSFTDLSEEERTKFVEDALEFDAIIATLVKSSEEWSEYTKTYNPYKTTRVSGLLKPIKFRNLLKKIYDDVPETVIVADPRFLKGFKTLFNAENFDKYIHWAYIEFLFKNGKYLSEDLRRLSGAFSRALTGVAKEPEPTKFAYQLASSGFSDPIGQYYGLKYFGEEAKKDVIEMVHEIISAYKERIRSNDILTEATKEKAIRKLDTMKIKMGYPDKTDEIYDKFQVSPRDSLYKAVSGIAKIELLDNFSKLYEKVDKTKWLMSGHTVNACYDPTSNDITFPAAILQAPFYSIKQTRSENLGGIGAVIGHEISHAFDNNGAKCDENGNLNNWWTKEDFKKFDKKTKAMINQFDGIELPYGKVNGRLIVSENIADNGGMAVTLHVMKKTPDADYVAYFTNWAKIWCQKATDQYRTMLLSVDVHGPNVLRTNMPPRNFEEWYSTFDVKKTDGMYLPPSKRVVIW